MVLPSECKVVRRDSSSSCRHRRGWEGDEEGERERDGSEVKKQETWFIIGAGRRQCAPSYELLSPSNKPTSQKW
jgi:hypothetical protein